MTKFLADENIPIEAVKTLQHKNIDIIPVTQISSGLTDRRIVDIANKQFRIH